MLKKAISTIVSSPHIILFILFAFILTLHISRAPDLSKYLIPESIYKFTLSIFFEADNDVKISTFLPLDNERQKLLDESIIADDLEIEERSDNNGRFVTWSGTHKSEQIRYSSLIALKSVRFNLTNAPDIPASYDSEITAYLKETENIPVHHKEIQQLWETIKPSYDYNNTYAVLQTIYNYTYHKIKPLPFKGLTDSLTTLRLQAASCNGKSRLFISLARLNNLPSRLVGGVILSANKKKTSHQWVEVLIDNHWVPFDVTNGHFASLPKHYLELYRGDHALFKHTSNINFDYYFHASKERLAPALYRDTANDNVFLPNAATLLQNLGLPIKTTFIFLLFPLCTLIISFLKNIVGIKTFGTFMPMLIAAACVYTGLLVGLLGFISVLSIAIVGHTLLGKFHVLKVPRLAAIITLISIMSLVGLSLVDNQMNIESGILVLFPAVIISFTADRIHQMSDENHWLELFQYGLGTLFTIWLCFLTFNSILLQGLFALYPELLLLVLAALLLIGSWTGMRVSEIIRFRKLILTQKHPILNLNSRNRDVIYKHNDKGLLKLATDKLLTKEALTSESIPCPETLGICRNHAQIDDFLKSLSDKKDFVIKPNKGSKGNGILVFTDRNNNDFITASNKKYSYTDLRKHVAEILSGSFSQNGEEDEAYIEPMIKQHRILQQISSNGLCDIRLIICNGKLTSAMLRLPTLQSNGKANLHQGAIGVSINLQSGNIERAVINGNEINAHPDSKIALNNVAIPFWDDIKDMALQCYIAIPLGYMGVDICIDETLGPLVLEVNGRPGLEIQNVHNQGMHTQVTEAF